MTKTKKLLEAYRPYLALLGALEHSNFGLGSDFGMAIANVFRKTHLLTARLYDDHRSEAGVLIAIISSSAGNHVLTKTIWIAIRLQWKQP